MKEYSTEDHPTDPISAVTSAFVGDLASIGMSVADFPRDIFKAARGKPKTQEPSGNATTDDATVMTNNADVSSTVAAAIPEDPAEAELDAEVQGQRDAETLRQKDAEIQQHAQAETEAAHKPRTLRLRPGNDIMGGLSLAYSTDSLPNPDDVVPARRRQRTFSNPETPPQIGSPRQNTSPHHQHDNLEMAMAAGKSVNNIVATGIRTPMNFCMGLAKGFRNLPKLYNDDTVRPPEKVKGFGSGLKIAGKEFGLGMYDGISGLVTQPYRGAQKEGALGLVKGFGKGIGGFAFKPFAGK